MEIIKKYFLSGQYEEGILEINYYLKTSDKITDLFLFLESYLENPKFLGILKSNDYLINLLIGYDKEYLKFSNDTLIKLKYLKITCLDECLIFLRDFLKIKPGNQKEKINEYLIKIGLDANVVKLVCHSLNYCLKMVREQYLMKGLQLDEIKVTRYFTNKKIGINFAKSDFEKEFKSQVKKKEYNNMIVINPEKKSKYLSLNILLSLRLNIHQGENINFDVSTLYQIITGKCYVGTDFEKACNLYVIKKNGIEKVYLPFDEIENSLKIIENLFFEEKENYQWIYQQNEKFNNIFFFTNHLNNFEKEIPNFSKEMLKRLYSNLKPLYFIQNIRI